jgi:adenylate kinase
MTREIGGKFRIVMLGAPGSGKGTQAKLLSEVLNIPHISTGDIFRKNISERTALGLKAKAMIDGGLLVPDEITNEIAKNRILEEDCANGFILDGYPRTLGQARYLDSVMKGFDMSLTAAVNIDVADRSIIDRLSGRRTCRSCGEISSITENPPRKDGACDICGGVLEIRADDKPETVMKRLELYHMETAALIDYYMEQGKLVPINGSQEIGTVLRDIKTALGIGK